MASLALPEVLAVCINSAINSGRTLSWKIQENPKGTSVQLFWRASNRDGDHNQESQVVLAPPQTRTRTKKKSPSQQRRSQKRLDDFIKAKSLEPLNTEENRVCAKPSVNIVESGHVDSPIRTSSVQDPLPQVAAGLPLQEKSLLLGDRTISNLGDPAPTPSHRLNSSKLARTTKPTPPSSKSLDLSACYSKQFEEGDKGVPGIRFTSPTGTSCWLPVRKGPIPSTVSIPYNIAASSLEDLMSRAKDVSYCEIEHHPGLKVRTRSTSRNISWIPIVTSQSPIVTSQSPIVTSQSPISYRTRSRTKHT